jgi:hypothetical protein
LKRAQDNLGRLHDIQVLIGHARQAQTSLLPPNLVTWQSLEALVDALEDDCRRLHARYMRGRVRLQEVCARFAARERLPAPTRVTA